MFNSPEELKLRSEMRQLGEDNFQLRTELHRAAEVIGQQQIYYKNVAEEALRHQQMAFKNDAFEYSQRVQAV